MALRLGGAVLDLVLPPRCLGCGAIVGGGVGLCAECWRALTFLAPPQCAVCGFPFEHEDAAAVGAAASQLCGSCARRPPVYDRARGVLVYDDASRHLVLAFKHGDRTDAARSFATWMSRAGAELIREADIVAPVPLHRWRLLRRRYNQAALLARRIAADAGLLFVPDLLERRRNTPSQGRLSLSARRRNVAGAFAVRPGRREELKERRGTMSSPPAQRWRRWPGYCDATVRRPLTF